MPRLDEVADRLERSAFARRTAWLGGLSPLATLRTFTPGAQALLAETERAAERALHVARGVLVLLLIGLGAWLAGDLVPAPVLAGALAASALGWWLLWRLLARPRLPYALRAGLVLFDAALALRIAVFVQSPAYAASGASAVLGPADAAAVTPMLLLLVAATGAYRLDPRLAILSMWSALGGYLYAAWALSIPTAPAVIGGALIVFTGVLGTNAARLFRHLALKAREEEVLERYVPGALTRELARTGDPLGPGRDVEITVLIVDIRGYTRRTERLAPSEAVAFLNEYFRIVVGPLAARGAVLDKYVGDGVFSFFEGEEHRARALSATREILAAVEAHNASRPDDEDLRIGIAVHSGQALVGTIGSAHKREYTAIADAVNVTARLEELNKQFDSRVVASEAVLAGAPPDLAAGFVGPETTDLRGREAALAVYYLP